MSRDLANVTDLRTARARRSGRSGDEVISLVREPMTVIVQASNIRDDAEVHRHIGVNDAITLAELHEVLVTCFDMPDEDSPWHFFEHEAARGTRISPQHQVSEFLWHEGDQIDYTWGLWDFSLVVAEVYPRDGGTPQALCVGGSGSFPGSQFDLTQVNAALTGQETITAVLTQAAPAVRDVIERSRLYDFVPLLQAMDLSRRVELTPEVERRVRRLPREKSMEGQDSFWANVMALACMGGEELTDSVVSTTMEGLGWVDDDGSTLTAAEVRRLCQASLDELESLGVWGDKALPPVERLDLFRALLTLPRP